MSKLRVLVVEDSMTVRKHLIALCEADSEIEVVGEAEDGKRAIELCMALRPDVLTLDMILPIMSGVAATEYIMAYCPTPILIVSASVNRGELFKTYDALAAGAVDVLDKPSGAGIDENWERRFISTLKLVSRIKVITHPRAKLSRQWMASAGVGPNPTPSGGMPVVPTVPEARRPRMIGMGVSTGGPAALVQILSALPTNYPIPILLVIHIGRIFATSLAEWLDSQSSLRVRHARDGELLPVVGAGQVIMAPSDSHMEIRNGKIRLTLDPERHSCRPSVDVLFESLAREVGRETVGCLLTGMGRDGAAGLLAIRQAGGRTWAQDEKSSVVFGMPREAVALGAAERVLPLDGFANALVQVATYPEDEP